MYNIEGIDKEKLYSLKSLSEISKTTTHRLRHHVAVKQLKASAMGQMNKRRYYIKGENFIEFVKALKEGSINE